MTGVFSENITCNITMTIPNLNAYNVTISQNSSFNPPINLIFTSNIKQVSFKFDEPGYYEVKVIENNFGTFSSKMINVTDFIIRKRITLDNQALTLLWCDPGLVNLIYAAYGNKDYKCLTQDGTQIAKNLCYLKKNCRLTASIGIFGNSPCSSGIINYLYIEYNCSSNRI